MRRALTFAALALATTASAEDKASRPMLSDACRTEIMMLCPKTDDRAARRQCIVENRAKISDGCKKELMAMRAARQGTRGNGDMAAPGAMTSDPQSPTPL